MSSTWSVGLMTGTVLDGDIDVALLRTDGETVHELGPWALVPYDEGVLALLEEAVAAARRWNFTGAEPTEFAVAERALTAAQGEAVARVLDENGIAPSAVAVVGFHGQTVLHRAPASGHPRAHPSARRRAGDGPRARHRRRHRPAHERRGARRAGRTAVARLPPGAAAARRTRHRGPSS